MKTIILVFLVSNLFGQVPVTYGGSYPQYFDYHYEGKYTLNESWVLVEKDTFMGYWQDSLFVSNNRMFLFKPDRIEKLTKFVPINSLFKGCSAGDDPYWALVAEYFEGTKYFYLVSFKNLDENFSTKMAVQNPVYNSFTGQVRVEQNGRIFYLFNPIKNSEQ